MYEPPVVEGPRSIPSWGPQTLEPALYRGDDSGPAQPCSLMPDAVTVPTLAIDVSIPNVSS